MKTTHRGPWAEARGAGRGSSSSWRSSSPRPSSRARRPGPRARRSRCRCWPASRRTSSGPTSPIREEDRHQGRARRGALHRPLQEAGPVAQHRRPLRRRVPGRAVGPAALRVPPTADRAACGLSTWRTSCRRRWRPGAFQGTQYALPVDPNMQILVYRKDLFEQKGLKPPATWDELMAAAKAFQDPGQGAVRVAVTGEQRHPDVGSTCSCRCGRQGRAGPRPTARAGVNTPAGDGRAPREIFLELLKYAPRPNVRSYTFPDVNKAIQTGPVAMAIQWASGAKKKGDQRPTKWPASSATPSSRRPSGRRRCAACGRSASPRTDERTR